MAILWRILAIKPLTSGQLGLSAAVIEISNLKLVLLTTAVPRAALFVPRLQFSRCELLEARIISKRIEHRIEPEQRRSER